MALSFPCCHHCPGYVGDTCNWTREHGKPHQMPCETCAKEKAFAARHEPSKSRHPSQRGKKTT